MHTIMHLLRVFIFTLLNNARYESIAVHLVILVLNFHFHLKTFFMRGDQGLITCKVKCLRKWLHVPGFNES